MEKNKQFLKLVSVFCRFLFSSSVSVFCRVLFSSSVMALSNWNNILTSVASNKNKNVDIQGVIIIKYTKIAN